MKQKRRSLSWLLLCVLLFGILCGTALTAFAEPTAFSFASAFRGERSIPDALFLPLLLPVLLFLLGFSRYASAGVLLLLTLLGGTLGFGMRSSLLLLPQAAYAPLAVVFFFRTARAICDLCLAISAVMHAHLLRQGTLSVSELRRLCGRFRWAALCCALAAVAEQGILALFFLGSV